MLVLGTLYLIWLAVKILRSTYDTKAVEPKKGQAYLSGLLLQFVNVKVMVSAIVSIQMFVLPYYQSTEALAAFAIFIAIAGTSCNLVWSGFGSIASVRNPLPQCITRSKGRHLSKPLLPFFPYKKNKVGSNLCQRS